ncbi:tail fiber assembly protein [Klebsiella pneumoniae]|uniref:tail fiber assembly protein n=1 Tax=Klebsiella pneumoniae TaxID=573 RepID=UPI00228FCEC2|nr:tail fiber assembly protein [Klebsiella pneumoniae]HDS4683297.1 tail fiber assembly protein [Klebsiella pneumoniae]HDS4696180.1 tail fiber assembly protein [Klebsiella pneumoniae subsp. pneumoniae]
MSEAYFSPSLGCFIPYQWKYDGTYNEKTWPEDAVEATEIDTTKYWKVNPPEGKKLGSIDGRPAWVDLPPQSKDELIKIAEGKKESLISSAMSSIAFIQLKLQAGRALSDMEKTKLYEVIDYIDALSSVDATMAPNIVWPE